MGKTPENIARPPRRSSPSFKQSAPTSTEVFTKGVALWLHSQYPTNTSRREHASLNSTRHPSTYHVCRAVAARWLQRNHTPHN